MNYGGESLAGVSSARQLFEFNKRRRAFEDAVQAENERKREVGEATIELNEQTKKQIEILERQLIEAQKANNLLVKQAADSARSARISRWLAIASLVVAIASLVVNFVRR